MPEEKDKNEEKENWRGKLGPLYSLMVAVQFLTRLPAPKSLNPTKEEFGACAPWFPVVGLIIGGLLALTSYGFGLIGFPPLVAGILILILGVLVTGGFHEDGLADTADGFGGGWIKEDVLRIMRDSRVGSYGAIAIALLFLLRASALWSMPMHVWPIALICAHIIARWSILPLMKHMPYARADQPGLGKPIVERISGFGLALSTIGVVIFCIVIGGSSGVVSIFTAIALLFAAGLYFKRRIGGITGDCLGSVAALNETATLIIFAALNHPM